MTDRTPSATARPESLSATARYHADRQRLI